MPFGSDYTGIRAMYEVISTAADTIENDEGTYFWWPSAVFCCGSFYSAVKDLFVVCILRRNN